MKPSREGSSIGVTKVNRIEELSDAYAIAARQDKFVLAEKFIDADEFTVSIVGERVLPSIRIVTPHAFYDYEAKYFVDTTEYFCPSGLPPREEKQLADLAWKAYKTCGCEHWGRVDVMRDTSGRFYLIEINPIPGMTDHSLVPKAAATVGIDFDTLVWMVLQETLTEKKYSLPPIT